MAGVRAAGIFLAIEDESRRLLRRRFLRRSRSPVRGQLVLARLARDGGLRPTSARVPVVLRELRSTPRACSKYHGCDPYSSEQSPVACQLF